MKRDNSYRACKKHGHLIYWNFEQAPKYFCKGCWTNYLNENGWSKGVDDLDNLKKEVIKMFSLKDSRDDLENITSIIDDLKIQYIRDRHDLAYFISKIYSIKKYEDIYSDIKNRFEILDLSSRGIN